MSKSTDTTEDARHQISTENRDLNGMIRWMEVKLSGSKSPTSSRWQLLGVLLLDQVTREVIEAENFSNVGFYARPAPGANAEATVAFAGGAQNPIIIATRDEDLRKKVANIDQGETMVFTNKACVYIKADGTIEIRSATGVANPVPTLAEFNALVDKVNNIVTAHDTHGHTDPQGGVTGLPSVLTSGPTSHGSGTTKVKLE